MVDELVGLISRLLTRANMAGLPSNMGKPSPMICQDMQESVVNLLYYLIMWSIRLGKYKNLGHDLALDLSPLQHHRAEKIISCCNTPKRWFLRFIFETSKMHNFLSKVARRMGLVGIHITVVRLSRGKVRIMQSVFPYDDWTVSVTRPTPVMLSVDISKRDFVLFDDEKEDDLVSTEKQWSG